MNGNVPMMVSLQTVDLQIWLPALLVLGFGIGILSGLFGVGGGFLLTPILRIAFGLPYPIAVGSGLPMITCTSLFSVNRHWKTRQMDPRLAMLAACSAICGAWLGKSIMNMLSVADETVSFLGREISVQDLTINSLFAVILGGLAVYIYWETSPRRSRTSDDVQTALSRRVQQMALPPVWAFPASGIARMSVWMPVGMGFCAGTVTGLLGVGGGIVNFPLLVYVFGVPTLTAVGTSAMQVVFAAASGTVLYSLDGEIDWILFACLLPTSVLGAQLGIWIAGRAGGRKIRRYLSVVFACTALFVMYGLLWGMG